MLGFFLRFHGVKAVLFIAVAVILGVGAAPVLAGTALVPCDGLNCDFNHLFVLLVNIYNFLIGMAAIVALLLIVFSGVKIVIFQFSESPESELTEAKHGLTRALVGLALVLMAFIIVHTLLLVLGFSGVSFASFSILTGLQP